MFRKTGRTRLNHVKWSKQDSPPPQFFILSYVEHIQIYTYIYTYICLCVYKEACDGEKKSKGRNQETIRKSTEKYCIFSLVDWELLAHLSPLHPGPQPLPQRPCGNTDNLGESVPYMEEIPLGAIPEPLGICTAQLHDQPPCSHVPSCLPWESLLESDHRRWGPTSGRTLIFSLFCFSL